MVLLSNDNSLIIKHHHILKCLNDKDSNFKKVIIENDKELLESYKNNNIDLTILITDKNNKPEKTVKK